MKEKLLVLAKATPEISSNLENYSNWQGRQDPKLAHARNACFRQKTK